MKKHDEDPLQGVTIVTETTDEEMDAAVMDDYGVWYSKDGKKLLDAQLLLDGKSEYVVKDGTEIICDRAFQYRNIESVVIPGSVIAIGDFAFDYCEELKSIVIPDSVKSIGKMALADCTSLEDVTISKAVTNIGDRLFDGTNVINLEMRSPHFICEDNCIVEVATGRLITTQRQDMTTCHIPASTKIIGEKAFNYCSSLVSVTIPDSVTSIEDQAFANCLFLASVNIPDSVTHIGEWAFYDCWDLRNVVLPESVTSIGRLAFEEKAFGNEPVSDHESGCF